MKYHNFDDKIKNQRKKDKGIQIHRFWDRNHSFNFTN